jgi:hypothetical protein
MIHTRPKPHKQWSKFIVNDEQKSIIQQWIDSEMREIPMLVIHAKKGNGSSHLVHAMANEFRKKGVRMIFLSYGPMKDDSILAVNVPQQEIIEQQLVFIDRIELGFKSNEARRELEAMLTKLAVKKCRVVCSMTPSEKRLLPLLTKIPFYRNAMKWELKPLNPAERLKWCKMLLERDDLEGFPDEASTSHGSNAAFLNTLRPHIQEMKSRKAKDHSFVQEYTNQLIELNLLIRKKQLEQAKLACEKAKAIRYQFYEQAATIREREKELTIHKLDLFNSLKTLYRELPFMPTFFDLHYRTIALLYEFDSKANARKFLTQKTEKYLHSLNKELLAPKKKGKSLKDGKILTELRDWHHALSKFDTFFKWYK